MLTSSDSSMLKVIFDSARLGLFSSANILQIADVALRVVLLLFLPCFQGHPMDLFLKISVLQVHFCWLGDVEEIIVPGRKVLLGKR